MDGAEVVEEAAPVVGPLSLERVGRRVLAAAQLHRDLETVGELVVEVLHAARNVVPVGAVGDAVDKVVARAVAPPRRHGAVAGGVHLSGWRGNDDR